MSVVHVPRDNEILGVKPNYYVGDLANLTCYSRGSSPAPELKWFINGEQVKKQVYEYY